MKPLTNLTMAIAMAFISIFPASAEGIKFGKLSLDEALSKAKKENKNLFIDIYATWCGPCKYLSNNVFVDQELGEFMNENFINIKLDGELEDGGTLMADFDLSSYPTMLFLAADKTLIRKIVGAVEAEEILRGANAVLHPEETAIFKLNKRYEAGERGREFMSEYISETFEEDGEMESLITEFIELYPKLYLENEDEFLVFCLGVSDLEDDHSTNFLSNIKLYNTLYEDMTEGKMKMMLFALAEDAIEKDDASVIDAGVEKLFEPCLFVFGADAFTKEELVQALMEVFEEG